MFLTYLTEMVSIFCQVDHSERSLTYSHLPADPHPVPTYLFVRVFVGLQSLHDG